MGLFILVSLNSFSILDLLFELLFLLESAATLTLFQAYTKNFVLSFTMLGLFFAKIFFSNSLVLFYSILLLCSVRIIVIFDLYSFVG